MVKTKILLVEDDKSLREIYGVRLYSEGYDIVSAGDGEEALALAIKERPALIISDVMMPKISGFDMLDILRSTTETRDIKVIMMTALSSEDQRARGESLGANRYLVKSQVGIEDVVRAVHEVLGDAPTTAPAGNTSAPVTPEPSMFTQPTTPAAPLPQPTAPFSTDRPATLGDRIIHPLENTEPDRDYGAMINAELNNASAPAAPAEAPAPAAPAATPPVAPAPAAPAPAPEDDIDLTAVIPPIPAGSLESAEQAPTTPPTPQPDVAPVAAPVPTATPDVAPATSSVPTAPSQPVNVPVTAAPSAPVPPATPATPAPAVPPATPNTPPPATGV